MTIRAFAETGVRPIKSMSVYANGNWRLVKTVRAFDGTQWRTVFSTASAMTATVSDSFVSQEEYNSKPVRVTSPPVTAIVSGGVGPYTYAWSVASTGSAQLPSTSNATVTVSEVLYNSSTFGRIDCVITDSNGSTASVFADFTLTAGNEINI